MKEINQTSFQFGQGEQGYREGYPVTANPYEGLSVHTEACEWERGWQSEAQNNPRHEVTLGSSVNDGIFRIVLHLLNGQICTHIENVQCGGFSHGHYFKPYESEKAILDYLARCKQYGVNPL